MLTRKGLQALVDGVTEAAVVGGLTRSQAATVAGCVVDALRNAGAVTPNYDGARFAAALDAALTEQAVPFYA